MSYELNLQIEPTLQKHPLTKSYTTATIYLTAFTLVETNALSVTSFIEEVSQTLQKKGLISFQEFLVVLNTFYAKYPSISVFALQISGEQFFLVTAQVGKVFLSRGSKIIQILESSGSITGSIVENDAIVYKIFDKTVVVTFTPKAVVLTGGQEKKQKWYPYLPGLDIGTKLSNLSYRIKVNTRPLSIIILVLILILFGSIGFGVYRQQESKHQISIEEALGIANFDLDEARALIELNPQKARTQFLEAETHLKTQLKKEDLDEEIKIILEDRLKEVHAGYLKALNKKEIKLETFFELSLIKQGATGYMFSSYEDSLSILDVEEKAVYSIDIESKSSSVDTGKGTIDERSFITNGEVYAYVLTRDVFRVVASDETLIRVIEKDDGWGTIAAFSNYGANLYLLDSQKDQIWKYAGIEGGFSEKQEYVHSDVIDFVSSAHMVINGSVWVANGDKILKFDSGVLDSWSYSGLDDPFGEELDIDTDPETDILSVFDKKNKRVVFLDKETGEYSSQYAWNDDIEVVDFMVSESQSKILLLSRDTIYSIDIE